MSIRRKNQRKYELGLIVCGFFLITVILTPIFEIEGKETITPVWERVFESPKEDAPTQLLVTSDGYLLTGSRDRGGPVQIPWLIKVDLEGIQKWNQSYTPESKPQGHIRSITQSPEGGYALTGLAFSTDSSTWDLWILKTDENGTEEWNKTINGTEDGPDYGSQIVAATDGGYLISGATQSEFASTESWDTDYWLLKTDGNGNLEWNKTYRREGYDQGTSLIPLNDGNYLMGGLSDHPHSIWILKIDENGTVLWDQTYTKGTESFITWERNLIETSDGGFLLTCHPAADNYRVGKEYWIIKCDSNGNIEWNTTFDGTSYDTPTVCLQSPTGDYYIGGSFGSLSDSSETGNMCILRLNSTGNIQGHVTYGEELKGERIVDMVLVEGSESSEALVALAFVENGGTGAGYRDFWLGKFDKVNEIQYPSTTTTTITTTPTTTTSATSFPVSILSSIGLGIVIRLRRKRGK
ncbi:hypothetical protein CEE45_02795 [Candidatus Heimdallarchaeota archaeon B3_Heim]|nr:MAG: hypothetical protein CEE45_02795 [Candidatus Heimdallarchaeota archaeon B3_Heim]